MSTSSAPTGPKVQRAPRPAVGTRKIRGLDAEQRRAQRREQILHAAFALFARDGYAGASIEEICQRAYVGNKAFYELFDSKEDCYVALHRQLAERIEDLMSQEFQRVTDEGVGGDEAVRRLLSTFAHALVDDPRVAVVGFREAMGISSRVEAQRRENRRRAALFIQGLWHRSHAVAEAQTDYHVLAVATIGGLFEAVADWLHESDPTQPRSIDDLIAEMTTFMSVVEAGLAARDKPRRSRR